MPFSFVFVCVHWWSFLSELICVPETIVGIHLHGNQGGLHIEDLGSSREPLDIMLVES